MKIYLILYIQLEFIFNFPCILIKLLRILIISLPEIPMKTKENEKTAHPNLKTLENCKQVNDALKEPKAAAKHDKKEPKVEKDNQYLKSLREKAKV